MKFDTTGLENYLPNQDLESNSGVWIQFPGDRTFLIYRAGGTNQVYSRRFAQMIKPHRRAMERGTLDAATSERIMRELYAETIVKDWRGIKDAAGNPVPFTRQNLIEFFDAFPEIFTELVNYATDVNTFVAETIEEAVDTLGKS